MTFIFLIAVLFQVFSIPILSPLVIGMIRKVKARLQNREGASVFQPYFDIAKLFQKNEVVSEDASWIFCGAPYIIFGVTIFIGASIPILTLETTYAPASDFLVIMYLFLLTTFFLALAGLDTGSGFGGFGSSREMMVSALAEGGLLFSLLVPSLATGTTNVALIVGTLQDFSLTQFSPILIAFLAFFIAFLAENSRFPVDNPSTHLELTMIHEAMILEYSGKRLALMEWAAMNKLLIFIVLGGNIFFPWGVSGQLAYGAILIAIAAFVLKTGLFVLSVAGIESTMAKFRIFRVPDLLFTSLVLGMIALSIIMTI